MEFERAAVSVHYKGRSSEIMLNLAGNVADREVDASSLALDLQAALNLASPPVGLRLRVAPGAEAVVCPLSVLIACPTYIATTFQGMSWFPLLGGEDDEGVAAGSSPTSLSTKPPEAPTGDPFLPPPLGSPLEHDLSFLATGSAASPAEGCGRPLTAPPGDRSRGGSKPRPGRREGLGRPTSATPSDKSFGVRRLRPAKSEGYFGRPVTTGNANSGSASPAWGLGSPHGFRCEETVPRDVTIGARRPSTAPAFAAQGLWRQSSSNLRGSRCEWGVYGERFGRGGDLQEEEFGNGTSEAAGAPHLPPDNGTAGGGGGISCASGSWTAEPPSECWV